MTELPRMYLAIPAELAKWLKSAAKGRGDTILYEHHKWSARAQARDTVDVMPERWRFTQERLSELANGA